ncbi:manganese/zinc/iron transport system permease protein [Cyclonatronum proteinivorum]|uniref:Manganese/zinc/iron transport system permease protein n=1 Tax=Cyclonatronum proteinivorum TaxID=1457365 RepID=A0A345UIB0_9BACT|nr:iron chelate uptake ABC transporter family permease subunit [Cyclonatronum proteinivorum]AXJ00212.1 manganese/zinc/iron transport system permease protein [Cyclonatronum proteinivorum]
MSEVWADFFLLQDPNLRWVLAGTVLLGLSAGALGCFTVLRERALVGDAVAHAVLPGVCMAFIITGDKDPLALLAGSVVFGWISLMVMDFVIRNSKISSDTSIGMVLSVFFGLGVMLLTWIQNSGNPNQSGLDAFLFGNAASMLPEDVMLFGMVSVMVLVAIVLLYKEFKLISFDTDYATVIGMPVKRMEVVMASLLVVTITAGLQAVGVVLMASMLIIPAAAARYWTDSLSAMLYIAAGVGAISAVSGTFVSYTAPSMPTGPWMVVSAAVLFALSFFFAPARGELQKRRRARKQREKVTGENILKTLYKMEERDGQTFRSRTRNEILKKRQMEPLSLKAGLRQLESRGLVQHLQGQPSGYLLTTAGREEARRVVRIHRLWELYLTEKLQLPGDHVHDPAESMEHVITPELEEQLMKILNNPEQDPHNKQIPRRSNSAGEGGA